MEQALDKRIKRQVYKVMAGISCFVVIYLLLLTLSGIMCYHAYRLWWNAITDCSALATILITIFFWIVPVLFTLNLVMFLFNRTSNKRDDRIEVTEQDCPLLFSVIKDLVREEGCKMPKKVFVSPDVNACVFYNTSFWNIFIPVRKNLEVGAGLLAMTNMDEVRSILAHEFGHFSQNSMKVGSALGITNKIITNLAYGNGVWDKFVTQIMRFMTINIYVFIACWILFGITFGIKKILQVLCKQTNKAYFELSRQMEYDADIAAAKVVGSNVFASGLRKIEFTFDTYNHLQQAVKYLAEEGKKINDIFLYHQLLTELIAENDNIKISADELLNVDVKKHDVKSKLCIRNTWDDHPTLEERVENLPKDNDKSYNRESAFSLIPENVRQKLTMRIYETNGPRQNKYEYIYGSELLDWSQRYLSWNYIPMDYRDFVNHDIGPFDLDPDKFVTIENPFTDANRKILEEYVVATSDLQLLQDIESGNIEVMEMRYEDNLCSIGNLPIEEHLAYVNSLVEKVNAIDYDILQYSYISCQNNEDVQMQILQLYTDLFAFNDLLTKKREQIRKSIEMNTPSEDDNSYDEEMGRNAIKLTIKSALIDGCNSLLQIVDKKELDNYRHIADNYERYSVQQMLDAISNISGAISHYSYLAKVRLARIYEKVSTGDIPEREDSVKEENTEESQYKLVSLDSQIRVEQYAKLIVDSFDNVFSAIDSRICKMKRQDEEEWKRRYGWLQASLHQTPLYIPTFQFMCFRFEANVYSILMAMVDKQYSETEFFVSQRDFDNFVRETKKNNLIPCILPIDVETKQPYIEEGIHLLDARTMMPFELQDMAQTNAFMSQWELDNFGITFVVRDLQKKGVSQISYCDTPEINPQIQYINEKGKKACIYVRSVPGGCADKSFEINRNELAKFRGNGFEVFFADVQIEFILGNNGDFKDKEIYRNNCYTVHYEGIETLETAIYKYPFIKIVDKPNYDIYNKD